MNSYEVWIYKAENDLKSAKKLLAGDDPIMDTSIYHTQQYVFSENLNPYATAFRYPDIYLEPDFDEVNEAIEMARKILDFVKSKI